MILIYFFDNKEINLNKNFINFCNLKLPKQRLEKVLRYRCAIDKWNCCVSYLLLTYGVKSKFGIDVLGENFKFNKFGKPCLKNFKNIYFNISHCASGVAVIVSGQQVGIDIQNIEKYNKGVAEHVLHKNEIYDIEKSNDKNYLFTKYWCLKECYVKYYGKCLSKDLKLVDFSKNIGMMFFKNKKIYKIFNMCDCVIVSCSLENVMVKKISMCELSNFMQGVESIHA